MVEGLVNNESRCRIVKELQYKVHRDLEGPSVSYVLFLSHGQIMYIFSKRVVYLFQVGIPQMPFDKLGRTCERNLSLYLSFRRLISSNMIPLALSASASTSKSQSHLNLLFKVSFNLSPSSIIPSLHKHITCAFSLLLVTTC